MKSCKLCKEEFEPLKKYYRVCMNCLPKCAGCKTCKKLVIPDENNLLKCCGHTEKAKNLSERSWPVGWHKDEWELLLFGLSSK